MWLKKEKVELIKEAHGGSVLKGWFVMAKNIFQIFWRANETDFLILHSIDQEKLMWPKKHHRPK